MRATDRAGWRCAGVSTIRSKSQLRTILLWLVGVPIPIVLLLLLLNVI